METDHRLVSMDIVNEDAPTIGEGRWTMPTFLLRDKSTIEGIESMCIETWKEVKSIDQTSQSKEKNVQVSVSNLKKQMAEIAKKQEKQMVPKLVQEL